MSHGLAHDERRKRSAKRRNKAAYSLKDEAAPRSNLQSGGQPDTTEEPIGTSDPSFSKTWTIHPHARTRTCTAPPTNAFVSGSLGQ
eukprot:66092-Chlamydomonas_euryale.AAC.1